MKGPDRAREPEPSFLGSIRGIRFLVRMAPLVALALTLAGTGCKNETDEALQKCREEVGRLEGNLLRGGADPELVRFGEENFGDSADDLLRACQVRTSRLEGLRGPISPGPTPSPSPKSPDPKSPDRTGLPFRPPVTAPVSIEDATKPKTERVETGTPDGGIYIPPPDEMPMHPTEKRHLTREEYLLLIRAGGDWRSIVGTL